VTTSKYDRYRWTAVALLVVAASLSAYANRRHDRALEALSYGCFLGAVFALLAWRRARRSRRGAPLDPADHAPGETPTRPDR
jgi:hypothetical protein